MRALVNRLRPPRHERERGVAMLVVIGTGMLMLALVATSLTIASNGLRKTDTDQDWNGALDAAYAGVEEYQGRLAADSSYFTYGNKDAPFSQLTGSTKLVLPTGTAANAAFGIGTAGTWATVPGSTPVASYRYEVDNSRYTQTGSIRIRVTGRVGESTRSIVADLKQSGFIDYLYFTDYEVQDPELTGQTYCETHIWEGRSNWCSTIRFGSTDVIDGPVHSNDTLTVCATTFKGKVTTSSTSSPIVITPSGCSAGKYSAGQTTPIYQPMVTMPPTNVQLKKETRNDLISSDVPLPGCLYTGPTVITFTSNGKMNVKSPWTVMTQISETSGVASAAPAMCGTPGTGSNGLGNKSGATIDVIPSNVIYVQNVPSLSSDPNYSSKTPKKFKCEDSNAGWSFEDIEYPIKKEETPSGSSSTNPAYGCMNGDVYVKGVFKGALTVAAENYVYVTGNLTYSDPAKDIIGLVGNGAVWVWNPMDKDGPMLTDSSRTIQAAIISVAHTFQVQNYNQGGDARGTLTVKGSIAQKFRGPVGLVGGSGYVKSYKYDSRFAYMAPPKFLSPVSSAYGVSQLAGVPTAFSPTGAAL